MKKIFVVLMVALIAVTSVFAAKAVTAPDFKFGGKAGWTNISGKNAVTFDVTISHDVYENDNFTVGVLTDFGLAAFTNGGARFTQYIGPTFTFKGIIPNTDVLASAGFKCVDYTDFFDCGVGADLKVTYWVAPGFGATVGGELTRLLKSHTNEVGAYVGITCQL